MKKKAIKVIYNIFLGVLVIMALLVVVSAFPIEGMYQIKVVQSGSMEPTIKTGSLVIIKPWKSYEVGDIITFRSNFKDKKGENLPVTHRIIEIKTEEGLPVYLTKGDANEDADTTQIQHNDVLGGLVIAVPYVGYGIDAAKTPYGFLAVVIIPAIVIIYDQIVNIWREVKKSKKGKNTAEGSDGVNSKSNAEA